MVAGMKINFTSSELVRHGAQRRITKEQYQMGEFYKTTKDSVAHQTSPLLRLRFPQNPELEGNGGGARTAGASSLEAYARKLAADPNRIAEWERKSELGWAREVPRRHWVDSIYEEAMARPRDVETTRLVTGHLLR